jgi:hypothetical protein
VSSVLVFVKYTYLRHYAEFFNSNLPSGTQITYGTLEVSSRNSSFFLVPVMLFCTVSISGFFLSDTACLDYIGLVLDNKDKDEGVVIIP